MAPKSIHYTSMKQWNVLMSRFNNDSFPNPRSVSEDNSCRRRRIGFHDAGNGEVPETMQSHRVQPKDAIQWEDSATFRIRSQGSSKVTGSLIQDINEDVCYSYEDHPDITQETNAPKSTTLCLTATRKPHSKRTVKNRKSASVVISRKPAKRKEHDDESRTVVRYAPSPSWLLEPDGDEPYALLASPFPNDLVKRQLHNLPEIFAKLVSKSALGANYGQAIRHLNKEISDPDPARALSDSNIWAVLVLAYSGREDKLRSASSYPRQSFLRELQSIHIYLKMAIVIEHVLGLVKMMELLGDMRKIKPPGIAQTVSWAGVVGAVRNLTRPIFPLISHTSTFIQEDGRLAVTQPEREAVADDLGQLGTSFWHVWEADSSTPAYLDPLFEVIQDICDFTIVVENHASGTWVPRTSPEIIDQRTFVQHKLMSLRTGDELINADTVTSDDIDPQYESCRLASIMFSFLVVFPVPPVIGPVETLTERLRWPLQASEWTMLDRRKLRLHLWILIIGAIASIGLPDRPWFLLRIMEVRARSEIVNWKELEALLKTFLWHPRTNDFDGLEIWKAVHQAKQIHTLELI
ncbi:hypothetical protein H2200_006789 [Cladophialophora chaetospira]|uniref:Uncharacterized protein n=1 Tax=Cladophialophora chaetospira TaxID=386627 RepID=A0AA38X8V8_9EURO|nr:hypothetical protein H2200_006789 [Cladophialophora chaetospira]